jgi:undecaprenyl diphosphate synthase
MFLSSTQAVPVMESVPQHIAIIMDGNGRWATKRFLPRMAGHAKGVDAVHTIVQACLDRGIGYLTLFAFSSENWRRPLDEVSLLMRLFLTVLEREIAKMHANNIRIRIVGDLSRFDAKLQKIMANAERKTATNTRMTLTICANYGGRWDILQAVNKMKIANPSSNTFTEEDFTQYLAMAYAPEPDLFIRTGGEKRISNFLLWQLAYTELYFTDMYWPDFDATALDLAITSYQERERRFGRTGDQVVVKKKVS